MGAVRTLECERARLQASLRLDGELSEIEEASLRAHRRHCVSCAIFERDLAALTGELRAAPPQKPAVAGVAPGVGVAPAVGVALARRRSATVRVLQLSAAAAAVILAAGLGSLAGSLSSPGPSTTPQAASAKLHGAAVIERGLVAMAPVERLPASRIRPAIAL
jgi:predicted anti-sigma-YlaC factor YlaD